MSKQAIQKGIPLGPFILQRPIGKGGMAEVWEGYHERQRVPVAVKVITAKQARKEQFLEAFRNEVYAVAGLDHPGIVMVFDYGEVDARAEQLSRGRMVHGSPYLAMELATGGSLFHVREPLVWPRLKRILQMLLDALGHAHARGVIHRDLKPGNVLLAGPGDMRPGLKLTDFGLAHALNPNLQRGGMGHTAGTPQYMAPEQFEGRWRDFGPWTDLYALGCMTFELASGLRPFDGDGFWDIHRTHTEGPPPFEPRKPLPAGFAAWLTRLLAWDPADRFQSAADALWGLLQVESGEPQNTDELVVPPYAEPESAQATTESYPEGWKEKHLEPGAEGASGEKMSSSAFFGFEGQEDEGVTPREAGEGGVDLASLSAPQAQAPPLARVWRRPQGPTVPMGLIGAGLGLYGIRAVPMIGRQQERDDLWSALLSVRRSSQASLVVIEGTSGCGKTRLAQWLCERAHELGGAISLRASWTRLGSQEDGLEAMMRRHLRCEELDAKETSQRCRMLLRQQGVEDRYEWAALAALIGPQDESIEPQVTFTNAMQRYVLTRRFLERAALERPVILWLEDAHWSSEALAFADYMMRVQRLAPCPVLLVLTAQREALEEQEQLRKQFAALERYPRASRVQLQALTPHERRSLVEALLVLEEGLARQVEERTSGNPQFTIQLVGDWVERGLLEVGQEGFTLRPGAQATIPDDIHQLWSERVQRFMAHRDSRSRLALELAAALGQNIDQEEWQRAAQALRLKLPGGLPQELASAQLATLRPHGWSFAHNMLRESLERSSRERARWVDLNRACASMLESRYRGAPQVAARLGHHLVQAGEEARALEPLLQGARWSTSRSEYARTMRLIALARELLRQTQRPLQDVIWGELLLQELLCLTEQGLSQEAAQLAPRAESLARHNHWHRLLPELHRLHAHALRKRGDLRGAARLFLKAHDGFEATGQPVALAACLRGLGFVFCQMGELDRAQRLCESAVTAYREQKDLLGVAESHQTLAIICRKREQVPQAERHARDALNLHTRVGYVLGQASSHNTLAEIARYRGQLAEAERGYRQAITLYERVGSRDITVPRLNLALVLLQRGEYRMASTELLAVQNELQEQERQGLEAVASWATLPCLAWTGDMDAWDGVFTQTQRRLQEMGMVDPDLAWLARLSGDLLSQRGQAQRAQASYQAAASLWKEPTTSRRRAAM